MPQYTYDFDPHGVDGNNVIKNETHSLPKSMSPYRIVIPKFAPFYYTKDLVVKVNNVIKEEGVDYYVVGKYITGTASTGKLLYSVIWFINDDLYGTVKLNYRTLGGRYPADTSVLNDYINNRQSDPQYVTWEEVSDSDPTFPYVDVVSDKVNLKTEPELIDAIDDITTAIKGQSAEGNPTYTGLKGWAESLDDVIDNSEIGTHQARRDNPHGVKWHQLGALHKDAIAKNTSKFNNYTLTQLADYINARGIEVEDFTKYALLSGGNTFTQDIVLKDELAVMRYDSASVGYALLNLSTKDLRLENKNSAVIAADIDKNQSGAYAKVQAGSSELKVVSSANGSSEDALRLDGKIVMTEDNIERFLSEVETTLTEVNHQNTATIRFTGDGTEESPLTASLILPSASETTLGVAKFSNSTDENNDTKAATAGSVKIMRNSANNYVPETRKINGKPLSSDITITKGDLGLNNVENVSDKDLPASDSNRALLANKANVEHDHDASEVDLPSGTLNQKGTIKLTNSPTSTSTSLAMSAYALSELNQEVVVLDNLADSTLPDDVIDLTQYGGNSYLPIPVQGSYEGSGNQSLQRGCGVIVEESGELVLLRNGEDVRDRGVYYQVATINGAGQISNMVASTTQYRPKYLSEGQVVRAVGRNTDDVMLALVENSNGDINVHLIMINGTFDSNEHQGYVLTNDIPLGSNDFHCNMPFVTNDHVYIYTTYKNGDASFKACVFKAPLTDLVAGEPLTMERITLSGKDMYGDDYTGETFKFTPTMGSNDPDKKPYVLGEADDYLTISAYHSARMQTDLITDGNRIHVLIGTTTVAWYQGGVFTGRSAFGFEINLDTGSLVLDDGCKAPLRATADRTWEGELNRNPYRVVTPAVGGRYAAGYRSKGFGFSTDVEPNVDLKIISWDARGETIENSQVGTRTIAPISSYKILGTYGSVSKDIQYEFCVGADKDFAFRQRTAGNIVRAIYDPNGTYGYDGPQLGPTTDRTVIDSDELKKYKWSILITKKDGSTYWGGAILGSDVYSSPINPMVDNPKMLTVDESKITTLHNQMVSDLGVSPIDSKCHIFVPEVGDTFATLWYLLDENSTNYSCYKAVYRISVDKRTGKIATINLEDRIINSRVRTNATSMSSGNNDGVNSSGIAETDNGYIYNMASSIYLNFVGWAEFYSTSFILDNDGTVSSVRNYNYDNRGRAEGPLLVPDVGLVRLSSDNSYTAVLGTVIETISDFEVGDEVLLHSSQVLEGWVIYFTEEIDFFINSTSMKLPVSQFDLKELFPTSYSSNTFYLYATIEGGTAKYEVLEQYVADNSTTVYIGYCKTDEVQIVELEVGRATRLGNFREFDEHVNGDSPHGLELDGMTPDDIGLGLVENKAIRNSLVIPTFKEVFDSWYRMSHYNEGIYPADATETEKWTFDEDTDSIRNTTNSATYVAMVSPEDVAVGDYRFITGVSSTSGDDDWIGVIFAFVEQDGIQHTLSALCSGTNTHAEHFQVTYNFHQGDTYSSKVLYKATTDVDSGWNNVPERVITVIREGDKFSIDVTAYKDVDGTAVSFEFDVTEHDELSMFRQAVRFGYSALSQPYSTWRNIIRPDEDGKNYYASQKLLLDNFSWSKRVKCIVGQIEDQSSDDENTYYVLPIPEQYLGMEYNVWVNYAVGGDSFQGISDLEISHYLEDNNIVFTTPRPNGQAFGRTATLSYRINFYDDVRLIR